MEEDRIIRMPELSGLTSLSPATIYRWVNEGRFPARRQLGPNSVGWLASEVQEWIRTRQRAMVPEGTREA